MDDMRRREIIEVALDFYRDARNLGVDEDDSGISPEELESVIQSPHQSSTPDDRDASHASDCLKRFAPMAECTCFKAEIIDDE